LGVIGVSDWITSEAERSYLSSASIMRRIYNWVDLDVFRPSSVHEARQRLGLPVRGTVVLGVASGWNDAKGLGDFNRLAERLFAGLNTPGVDSGLAAVSGPVSIVLVGGVGRRTSASQRINLVGVTHDVKQLADYYSAADVFLQLSSEETFGR